MAFSDQSQGNVMSGGGGGFMKPSTYSSHINLSLRTLRTMMKEGLPFIRLPSGRILIEVSVADNYLRSFSDHEDREILNSICEGIT